MSERTYWILFWLIICGSLTTCTVSDNWKRVELAKVAAVHPS